MNAMFTNRVGDYFLTLGFFAIIFTFGTLDYTTVFSLAPYINTNVITFISLLLLLGAAAKSAQLGLHIWLPQAMEGLTIYNFMMNSINSKENINLTKNNLRMKNEFDPENKYIEDAIIGDLLGDGHLSVGKYKEISRMNARLEFTFSVSNTLKKIVTFYMIPEMLYKIDGSMNKKSNP
jgi:hypothetical protein